MSPDPPERRKAEPVPRIALVLVEHAASGPVQLGLLASNQPSPGREFLRKRYALIFGILTFGTRPSDQAPVPRGWFERLCSQPATGNGRFVQHCSNMCHSVLTCVLIAVLPNASVRQTSELKYRKLPTTAVPKGRHEAVVFWTGTLSIFPLVQESEELLHEELAEPAADATSPFEHSRWDAVS